MTSKKYTYIQIDIERKQQHTMRCRARLSGYSMFLQEVSFHHQKTWTDSTVQFEGLLQSLGERRERMKNVINNSKIRMKKIHFGKSILNFSKILPNLDLFK